MAAVTFTVTGLLRDSIGGAAKAVVQAATAGDAVDVMLQTYPGLRVHLYDEQGTMRQHVFLALNGRSLRGARDLAQPVRDGDRLAVVQAVSGG